MSGCYRRAEGPGNNCSKLSPKAVHNYQFITPFQRGSNITYKRRGDLELSSSVFLSLRLQERGLRAVLASAGSSIPNMLLQRRRLLAQRKPQIFKKQSCRNWAVVQKGSAYVRHTRLLEHKCVYSRASENPSAWTLPPTDSCSLWCTHAFLVRVLAPGTGICQL